MIRDERAEVEAKIFSGELSLEEAEKLAFAKNWPSFFSDPDPKRQDPMQEPRWDLSMALAWLAWAEPAKVCEHWNDHLHTCFRWMKTEAGYGRSAYPRVCVSSMLIQEYMLRGDRNEKGDWLDAEADKKLFKALKEGIITARADRQEVTPNDWSELHFCQSPVGHDALKEKAKINLAANVFQDFTVSRDQVLALASQSAPLNVAPKKREMTNLKSQAPRTPGQKSFEGLDQPLLIEMKALIENHSVVSAEAAGHKLASKAAGLGSLKSKADRLAKRYRKTFP